MTLSLPQALASFQPGLPMAVALSGGADARAATYIELKVGKRTLFGVGLDANIVTASFKAILSALNRAKGVVRKPATGRAAA